MQPSRIWCWALTAALVGCQHFNLDQLRSQSPEEQESLDDEFESKIETPLIGEYTRTGGLNVVTLQGVGLVTGLDGTGTAPPTSHLTTMLLDEMRRRGVRNPNAVLRSPSTALVIVRAYLPPLIRKGEHFDIEVRLPGNSESASLHGGWLLETYLSEQALVPGRGLLKGKEFAKAKGPILISVDENKDDKGSRVGVVRRGRVLGGGVSLKDRDMALFLRNDFRSIRNSQRVAERVGRRFQIYNRHGLKEPVAEAKTDQKIELKILPKYKDNYPRYLQVIRNIAFRETAVARRLRTQALGKQLLMPHRAERAALQLEAIGPEAVPVLKEGLKSPSLEVRFHSATALAYLDEPAGLPALAEAVRVEPAFRVFGLAAMAAVDDVDSHMLLRKLMSESSAETRYGAFRSLSTLDQNDPFIRADKLNGEFHLHVLQTDSEPMIHITRRRKAEIVLFGADQRFSTPLVVRAGKHILVTAAAGSREITVSRFEVNREDKRKVISTRVADVIRTVADFGATYPDVVQMLAQADQQRNTQSRLQIDALPRAGRRYYRPSDEAVGGIRKQARVGNANLVPNLFEADEPAADSDEIRPASAEENGDDKNQPEKTGDVTSADFEVDKPPADRFKPFRFLRRRSSEP